MIPAALPVVPISLSLLARYVKEKRGKKGKNEKRKKKPTAFYFSFQIIHSEQHLSSAYACLCVYVSQTWQVGGSLVVHVRSIKKCIFVVVVHGSLFVIVRCTLPRKVKSNGHHLPAGRCQLCCEAENPNSPSPKRGRKKEKRKKRKENRPFPCSVRIYSRRISMRLHSARNGSDSGH